jgi:hypothetical protein
MRLEYDDWAAVQELTECRAAESRRPILALRRKSGSQLKAQKLTIELGGRGGLPIIRRFVTTLFILWAIWIVLHFAGSRDRTGLIPAEAFPVVTSR